MSPNRVPTKKNTMHLLAWAICAGLLSPLSAVSAQTSPPQTAAPMTSPTAPMVDAEVRKVDKDAGKITLKHGPITNLEMPGMTMVFRVKDPAMLDKVKEGDKIRITADKIGGTFTVMSIEPSK